MSQRSAGTMPEKATYTAPVPGLAAVLGALVADGSAVPAALRDGSRRRRLGGGPARRQAQCHSAGRSQQRHIAHGSVQVNSRSRHASSLRPQIAPSRHQPFSSPGIEGPPVNEETGQVTTSFELTIDNATCGQGPGLRRDVLREAKATAERLPSAEERFLATNPRTSDSSRRAFCGPASRRPTAGQREPHRHRGGDGGAVLRETPAWP